MKQYIIKLAKALTAGCILTMLPLNAFGVEFGEVFADSTLRLDYIFSGTRDRSAVTLRGVSQSSGWAGRKHRLAELPLAGNGQVTVTSAANPSDTVYRTSFSSLYLEWLDAGDSVQRAYEHTVLIPQPKAPVNVHVDLRNIHHDVITSHNFRLDPKDILIGHRPQSHYDTIMVHKGAFAGNKIQVAILPEGYTAEQMADFVEDARTSARQILAHEPFASLGDRFDFVAVCVPSADSGVSIPKNGDWRNTAFGSHFSTFYSDRYLTTPNVFDVHDALTGIPYEHIIILANTDEYGGGGIYNSYTLTAAKNKMFHPVVVHEFGHSFGGLGDEYFYEQDILNDVYPKDIEPWEPNITTLVDFDSKWKHLLAEGTPVPTPVEDKDKYPVGVYEGGGYSFHGVYRPADVCRMRINDIDHFCPACIDALRRLILYYTEE